MAELPNTIEVYKNEGETPLGCLDRFRVERPEFAHVALSYAGRLDPMAEGVLLVLVGEENKNREQYLGLDKEYEVEVLFGVGTDTGDVLGVISDEKIIPKLNNFVGRFEQSYPNYSSKTVQGKPLFQWAREGRLKEIEIPTKEVEVYSIEKLGIFSLKRRELFEQVQRRIAKVNGDFRQQEIMESWKEFLKEKRNEKFEGIKIKVSCSSGTYMRTLAENMGKQIGVPAIAWSIKRTKISV